MENVTSDAREFQKHRDLIGCKTMRNSVSQPKLEAQCFLGYGALAPPLGIDLSGLSRCCLWRGDAGPGAVGLGFEPWIGPWVSTHEPRLGALCAPRAAAASRCGSTEA